MSRRDRVTFFSKRDAMRTTMLEKAEVLLQKEYNFAKMTLNDLLEFHHVQEYFENDLFLDSWTPEPKSCLYRNCQDRSFGSQSFSNQAYSG
jgi:hypothetical protein